MPGKRRSIRLRNYDYSQQGVYYVTLCLNRRQCLFGEVDNGKMVLNDAGRMVDKWWQELMQKYNTIEIDQYIIMPNHIHGIIAIVGADLCVRPDNTYQSPGPDNKYHIYNYAMDNIDIARQTPVLGQTHRSAPTVPGIVQWFKTMTTNEYMRNIKHNDWQLFDKHL